MAFAQFIYQTVFKRNSVFVGSVFASAFAFGIGFDLATQKLWQNHNKGKLWSDVRDKLAASSDE